MNDPDLPENQSLGRRMRRLVIGEARDVHDRSVFHKLSLIAFFAWIGLGADGLSSSSYGPEEAFRALSGHPYLSIFIGIASAITVFIISSSYTQIIRLFPAGGGGYLVASKLLHPVVGMISGCALLIDYVLTISLSIASGIDALFSFLPTWVHEFKLEFALVGVVILIILNLRGTKESVVAIMPIFLVFVLTHAFMIIYVIVVHAMDLGTVTTHAVSELQGSVDQLGIVGTLLLLMRAYSMGAGTYTGIEAVSNGIPILREPRVETAKHTMRYMAISLAVTVLGLMFAYALYNVSPSPLKTLNAVLLESMTAGWNTSWGYGFMLVTLISEAALLFVAAQTGFLDGPRVLSNMATDRWFPTKFATLSDRLVTQNGILLMGAAAVIVMVVSKGSVHFLVILYSINVFITFSLSQLGMVRHWWQVRHAEKNWWKKALINGIGVSLTLFILFSVIIIKFEEGGWITLIVTGALASGVALIRRHYTKTFRMIKKLDESIVSALDSSDIPHKRPDRTVPGQPPPPTKTAVLLVNGFGGLGLHTLFMMMRSFKDVFNNFVFVQIGVIDAGNFKGAEEVDHLETYIRNESGKYVTFMEQQGYSASAVTAIGTDVVTKFEEMYPQIAADFPNAVFFCGQLVFPKDSYLTRFLHNYTAFSIQRLLYSRGVPIVILPVRVRE
jgi:amino acid transporter